MHALEELLQQGGLGGNGGGGPLVMTGDPSQQNPIVCPRCGRCRCEQCQSPRPLPQTWVCNKTCLCSAESVIDYASCLCCAKALFYHCARDNDLDCDDGNGTPCVDNPCSCGPYKRTQRWGWLGALSIFLPCLWFYWPMRGCMKLCEKCYGRFAGRGCRCQGIGGGHGMGAGVGGGAGGIGSTSSMLPIVPLGVNGSGLGGGVSLSGGITDGGLNQSNGKAMEHGCSRWGSDLDLEVERRAAEERKWRSAAGGGVLVTTLHGSQKWRRSLGATPAPEVITARASTKGAGADVEWCRPSSIISGSHICIIICIICSTCNSNP